MKVNDILFLYLHLCAFCVLRPSFHPGYLHVSLSSLSLSLLSRWKLSRLLFPLTISSLRLPWPEFYLDSIYDFGRFAITLKSGQGEVMVWGQRSHEARLTWTWFAFFNYSSDIFIYFFLSFCFVFSYPVRLVFWFIHMCLSIHLFVFVSVCLSEAECIHLFYFALIHVCVRCLETCFSP